MSTVITFSSHISCSLLCLLAYPLIGKCQICLNIIENKNVGWANGFIFEDTRDFWQLYTFAVNYRF